MEQQMKTNAKTVEKIMTKRQEKEAKILINEI